MWRWKPGNWFLDVKTSWTGACISFETRKAKQGYSRPVMYILYFHLYLHPVSHTFSHVLSLLLSWRASSGGLLCRPNCTEDANARVLSLMLCLQVSLLVGWYADKTPRKMLFACLVSTKIQFYKYRGSKDGDAEQGAERWRVQRSRLGNQSMYCRSQACRKQRRLTKFFIAKGNVGIYRHSQALWKRVWSCEKGAKSVRCRNRMVAWLIIGDQSWRKGGW